MSPRPRKKVDAHARKKSREQSRPSTTNVRTQYDRNHEKDQRWLVEGPGIETEK